MEYDIPSEKFKKANISIMNKNDPIIKLQALLTRLMIFVLLILVILLNNQTLSFKLNLSTNGYLGN